MPAVTIAIPAFKPRHLAEAIESVLRQDFTDYELLISDDRQDGSIDAVVDRFDDPRVKLLRGPRSGLVANSAFLWDNASGDFLKFLYDDDLLHASAVRELGRHITKRDDFVYSFCNRLLINDDGEVLDRPRAFQGDGWMWFNQDYIPNYLMSQLFNRIGEPSNILGL